MIDRSDLTADQRELLQFAAAARESAYAPYSQFQVGAALRVADGTVYTGANVENAAFAPTICAERVALPAAVVAGNRALTAIAVVGTGDGPCTPCGVCRQALYEFAPDLIVIAAGETGDVLRLTLGTDLLPHGFGPLRLG